MIGSEVADMSFSRVSIPDLIRGGAVGVIRYVLGAGKGISVAEYDSYQMAGFPVAFVMEAGGQAAMGGWATGVAHAQQVNAELDAIGFPRSRPVWYVGEDPSPAPVSHWPTIAQYFAGIDSVRGRSAWVYGSGALISYLKRPGWEVSTWAGAGSRYSKLRQLAGGMAGRSTFGGAIDHNIVLTGDGDWGQWPSPPQAPTGVARMANKVDFAWTPTGLGYWEVGADGGVFSHGDAQFCGSLGNVKLAAPVVSVASMPPNTNPDKPLAQGYWLASSDGGVFAFGDAPFYGGLGNVKLAAPIVAIRVTPTGKGYVLEGADGGIFTFGDAHFEGAG